MSELIYFRTQRGGVEAQLWHIEEISQHSKFKTNARGNLEHPSQLGENCIGRINDDEKGLSIDELCRRYPLTKEGQQ